MGEPREVMALGGRSYGLTPLFSDRFDGDMSAWSSLNPGTKWGIRDGALVGEWRRGGSAVWLKQVFEGDLLVSVRAEALAPSARDWEAFGPGPGAEQLPEGGKNLNLFFMCSGPDGERMEDCYARLLAAGTGPNGCGDDQYRGYLFTWTIGWARLRRLPGYELAGERMDFAPQVGKVHEIVALRRGANLRYFADGELIHDCRDENSPARGQMGFCLWRNLARLHEFSVYRIVSEEAGG